MPIYPHFMSVLVLADAIKEALGLSDAVKGAIPVARAATEAMGMDFEPGTTLPVKLAKLAEAIGLTITEQAAAPAAAAAAQAASADAGSGSGSGGEGVNGGASASRAAVVTSGQGTHELRGSAINEPEADGRPPKRPKREEPASPVPTGAVDAAGLQAPPHVPIGVPPPVATAANGLSTCPGESHPLPAVCVVGGGAHLAGGDEGAGAIVEIQAFTQMKYTPAQMKRAPDQINERLEVAPHLLAVPCLRPRPRPRYPFSNEPACHLSPLSACSHATLTHRWYSSNANMAS